MENQITEEKASWWYWFKKLDGNLAECNKCGWLKNRGAARSTSILRCHLKTRHPDLLLEKLEADKLTGNIGKQAAGQKKRKLHCEEKSECLELEVGLNSSSITDDDADGEDSLNSKQKIVSTTYADDDDQVMVRKNIKLEQSRLNNVFMSIVGSSFGMFTADISSGINTNSTNIRDAGTGTSSNLDAGGVLIEEINDSNNSYSSINNYAKNLVHIPKHVDQPLVKLCRVESFSAAHRLHNPGLDDEMNQEIYGKCNSINGHGHNYTWKVVLEGPVDAQTGMVYNLSDLKREMALVMELVDHKNLDKDVPYFRDSGIVSTTENLAVFLFDKLAAQMISPGLLKKVVVGETDKNSFTYSGRMLSKQ